MTFPRVGLLHLVSSQSDHYPIILDTVIDQDHNVRPFQFFNAWFRDVSCKHVIKQAWQTQSWGSPLHQLVQKLKVVKGQLKEWNREAFGYTHTRIHQITQFLEILKD